MLFFILHKIFNYKKKKITKFEHFKRYLTLIFNKQLKEYFLKVQYQ